MFSLVSCHMNDGRKEWFDSSLFVTMRAYLSLQTLFSFGVFSLAIPSCCQAFAVCFRQRESNLLSLGGIFLWMI